jgi:hypothetical protein
MSILSRVRTVPRKKRKLAPEDARRAYLALVGSRHAHAESIVRSADIFKEGISRRELFAMLGGISDEWVNIWVETLGAERIEEMLGQFSDGFDEFYDYSISLDGDRAELMKRRAARVSADILWLVDSVKDFTKKNRPYAMLMVIRHNPDDLLSINDLDMKDALKLYARGVYGASRIRRCIEEDIDPSLIAMVKSGGE